MEEVGEGDAGVHNLSGGAQGERRFGNLSGGDRRRGFARLAHVVGHARRSDSEIESRRHLAKDVVSAQDKLRAPLDHRVGPPGDELLGPDATAYAITRLEHRHVVAEPDETVSARQPCEARSDDYDAHRPSLA